ncbi:MAG TPA: hypothetical protein VFK40_02105, partial [Nitrososphaeraceae archaeon]|nr:hypothetical protein [Nitrososphaeraceae archaeon]
KFKKLVQNISKLKNVPSSKIFFIFQNILYIVLMVFMYGLEQQKKNRYIIRKDNNNKVKRIESINAIRDQINGFYKTYRRKDKPRKNLATHQL